MARNNWQEEVPGGSMPVDLTVDPIITGNAQFPADWVEMTGGGTLTYTDGSGQTQTLTSTAPGYVVRSKAGFHKLTSLSGASPNIIRCGTGEGPSINYDAGAASSASAAATSATAAAAAVTAFGLTPSTTVITADPAPAVIGTLYDCDPSGGAFNLTLPAIGSGNHGKRIGVNVTTTSAHAVTPVPNGTDVLPANVATVSGAYGLAIFMADNGASPKAWRRVG